MNLNILTREVRVNGKDVSLTQRELLILNLLKNNLGECVHRNRLYEKVWGWPLPKTNIADVYINRIRKKIGAKHIQTVRGKGYLMVAA